jgi:DNA-binding NtrC family response regulator
VFTEPDVKINTIMLIGNKEQEFDTLMPMLGRNYNILCFGSGDDAAVSLRKQEPVTRQRVRVIICEQNLQDMAGSEFLERSISLLPRAKRILLIDYPRLDMDALQRAQLFRFITKPYRMESLVSTIRMALKEIEKEKTYIGLDPEIVGRDPRFQEVLDLVRRVNGSGAGVLVRGETGTGKELVARALHHSGPRSSKPYVVVNCSAIPETLFEAEMFGHKKGAFTGAYQDHKGRVAQAEGGTLFIDEVGDVPLYVQAKLLRFLQFGEFHRVGGNRIETANVRLVAATNRNLEQMIEDGAFRQDLYYRLKVLEVELPPLRERLPDIRLLAGAFIRKYWTRPETPVLSDHTLKVLEAYDFPGNVRELENIMKRACILARTEEIDLDVLPPELIKKVQKKKPRKPGECPPDNPMFTRLNKEELKRVRIEAGIRAGFQVEEVFLRQLMDRFGTVTRAAAHAGMQRTYLHSLLTKHGFR